MMRRSDRLTKRFLLWTSSPVSDAERTWTMLIAATCFMVKLAKAEEGRDVEQ